MEKFLSFLVLMLISIHTKSTFPLQIADLSHMDIALHDAKNLCRQVHKSRIQSSNTFMWIEVKSVEEAKSDEPKTLRADCFRAKYIECEGEPRYPISTKCGFFTLVPEKECVSTGRFRRSTPTKQISLSHSDAVQLCSSIQNLPEESIPLRVQFVPIKLSMTGEEKSATLGDQCVRWTNEPCDEIENEEQMEECRVWKLVLHADEKCPAHLSKFYKMSNSSLVASLPNPMHRKTDFVHSTNLKPEDRAYGVDVFADVIECKSEGSSVNCRITPKPQESRSKRAVSNENKPTQISRVKRQCCGLYGCYHCLSAISGNGIECDCNVPAEPVDDVCPNLGLCDTKEYPNGCYGDCDIG